MTTEALDFYAYWNGAQVADLWTTLALITGTDDYRSLLLCVALFGLICAAAGAAVRYDSRPGPVRSQHVGRIRSWDQLQPLRQHVLLGRRRTHERRLS